MIRIKILETGEIRKVTRNEAHGLIDRGVAKLVSGYESKEMMPQRQKRHGYITK